MANAVGNPNIAEAGKGTRFSKTNQTKNSGRKPSKLKKWIKDYDISKSDIDAVLKTFLYGMTLGEIVEIINDEEKRNKLPAALGLQIQILWKQAMKGDGKHIEALMYMLFGKPTQQNIVEISDISDNAKDRLDRIFDSARGKDGTTETADKAGTEDEDDE